MKAGTRTGVAHLKGQQAVVSIQVLPAPSKTPDAAASLHTFHLYLACEDSCILLAALQSLDWRLKQLSVPAVWFLYEGYPLSAQWHLAGHSLHAQALSLGQYNSSDDMQGMGSSAAMQHATERVQEASQKYLQQLQGLMASVKDLQARLLSTLLLAL